MTEADLQPWLDKLADPDWRIRNLYVIDAGDGKVTPLVLREEQKRYLHRRHTRNFVPKARKLGMSTIIVLSNGDSCVFNENFKAAIVDRTEPDAWEKLQIFRFAWENGPRHPVPEIAALWVLLHEANPLATDNDGEMGWSNGAVYQAKTQFTGRTPQALHISELGPICDESETKGEKILQGSINAVLSTGIVDIETTMRAGQSGACARLFKLAKAHAGRDHAGELGAIEWRLHFFSWLGHPDYRLAGRRPDKGETLDYFAKLKDQGIVATDEQQAWYESKQLEQGEKMFAEYPSTIEECDKATVAGAIYPQIATLRAQGRVRAFNLEPGYPLFVFSDLGVDDNLALILLQPTPKDINWLDYEAGTSMGAMGVVQTVQRWQREHGDIHGVFVPHDADTRDKGSSLSFRSQMSGPGLLLPSMIHVVPRCSDIWAGIDEVRRRLPRVWVHSRCDREVSLSDGTSLPSALGRLEGYRKRITKGLLVTSEPVHDICSHLADAWRNYAEADSLGMVKAKASVTPRSYAGAESVRAVRALTGRRHT